MQKVLCGVAVMLLLTSMAFADIDPTNSRPVGVNTGDGQTLQAILDIIYSGDISVTDQDTAGIYQLGGLATRQTGPILEFEYAGYASSNTFGIWSGHDPNNLTMVEIFKGSAGPNASAVLKWTMGSSNTVEISGGAGVNAGTFPGIDRYWFGFYLSGPGGTFYTADQLNGGNAQVLAYRRASDDLWTFAFEDVPLNGGADRDYNDMVVTAESITPVPEPGTVLVLGAMLLASVPLRRYLSR